MAPAYRISYHYYTSGARTTNTALGAVYEQDRQAIVLLLDLSIYSSIYFTRAMIKDEDQAASISPAEAEIGVRSTQDGARLPAKRAALRNSDVFGQRQSATRIP